MKLLRRCLLLSYCAATGAGAVESKAARQERDTTPSPCKKEYAEASIKAMADTYLEGIPTGHAQPRMLLLLGGSGAGKGTFVKHLGKHGFPVSDYVMHGIDDYLEMLPEWRASAADPLYVYKDAADGCYGGAIPVAKAAQSQIIEKKMNVIYEETGKNLERVLKRVLPPFVDAGYDITIALVDGLPAVAKERAADRFLKEGRYSSPDYVEGTFKNVFENYEKMRDGDYKLSASIYCDNSCIRVKGVKEDLPGNCMRCWNDTPEHRRGAEDSLMALAGALLPGKTEYMPPPPATAPSSEL